MPRKPGAKMSKPFATRIPPVLAEIINGFIKDGLYTTYSDFMRDSMRRRIEEIKRIYYNEDELPSCSEEATENEV